MEKSNMKPVSKEMVEEAMAEIKKGPKRKIYRMGLDKHLCYDETKIKTWAPIDFIKEMDRAVKLVEKYMIPLRTKKGPNTYAMIYYDIENEFGEWSRIVNKNIKEMLKLTVALMDKKSEFETNERLHEEFSWAYSYWWNRFSYLRSVIKSRSRFGGISKKKRIEQARVTLKKLITGELKKEDIAPHFHKLVYDIKMGNVLNKEYKEIQKQWEKKNNG